MQRTPVFATSLSAFLIFGVSASAFPVNAVGWYSQFGVHNPGTTNYIVGNANDPSGTYEYRNFFAFSLYLDVPIASATLTLYEPGYSSDDPSENYELHDVVTSIPDLIAGAGGVAAFDDLGTGVVYGSRTMTPADDRTTISIPLNSNAVAALNNTTGLFAIGGSLTTLGHFPRNEFAFGFSDQQLVTLQLTFVPEPTSAALVAFAAMILGMQRSRKRLA